jgi:nickel-dependent lactate racemase
VRRDANLPYGRRPYPIALPATADVEILEAATLAPPARTVEELLDQALRQLVVPATTRRITLVVSDATRNEPRAAFIEAIRRRLPAAAQLTVAIATGTHGPAKLDELAIPAELLRGATVVNHDGHRIPPADLVELGTTPRGTPVRLHRCVVDTDLVIATGCIRPHYFAGFGAGSKALFPGLGEADAIRINHRLKTHALARAGILDGNPCREDLADDARLVRTPVFVVNGVCDPDDRIQHVVAGDLDTAFRSGCDLARPWFEVRAKPAPLVIASDALPVTASLYQAAKIGAAAAPLVATGGTLVLVAECADGIGPLDTVNEAIFRIGVLPRLPADARLVLVSNLDEPTTNRTLLAYAPSVDAVLANHHDGRILVLPHASKLIATPLS